MQFYNNDDEFQLDMWIVICEVLEEESNKFRIRHRMPVTHCTNIIILAEKIWFWTRLYDALWLLGMDGCEPSDQIENFSEFHDLTY